MYATFPLLKIYTVANPLRRVLRYVLVRVLQEVGSSGFEGALQPEKEMVKTQHAKLMKMRSTIKDKEKELDDMEEDRSPTFSSGSSLFAQSGNESDSDEPEKKEAPALASPTKPKSSGTGPPPKAATVKSPPPRPPYTRECDGRGEAQAQTHRQASRTAKAAAKPDPGAPEHRGYPNAEGFRATTRSFAPLATSSVEACCEPRRATASLAASGPVEEAVSLRDVSAKQKGTDCLPSFMSVETCTLLETGSRTNIATAGIRQEQRLWHGTKLAAGVSRTYNMLPSTKTWLTSLSERRKQIMKDSSWENHASDFGDVPDNDSDPGLGPEQIMKDSYWENHACDFVDVLDNDSDPGLGRKQINEGQLLGESRF